MHWQLFKKKNIFFLKEKKKNTKKTSDIWSHQTLLQSISSLIIMPHSSLTSKARVTLSDKCHIRQNASVSFLLVIAPFNGKCWTETSEDTPSSMGTRPPTVPRLSFERNQCMTNELESSSSRTRLPTLFSGAQKEREKKGSSACAKSQATGRYCVYGNSSSSAFSHPLGLHRWQCICYCYLAVATSSPAHLIRLNQDPTS